MRLSIPYINTRIETDLILTLLGTPLWWVLGFNIFIYQAIVLVAFIKLIVISMMTQQAIKVPKTALWFLLFLTFYLGSVLINLGNRPFQRIFASLNNYSMLVMGYLMMVIIYNSEAPFILRLFLKACRSLSFITGVIGVSFLILWFTGGKHFEMDSVMARMAPFLMDYPYFHNLLIVSGATTDWLVTTEVPRLTLYSIIFTATGGLMLVLIPPTMAYYALLKGKRLESWGIFLVSLIILFFSLSRAAIYSFIGAWVFVSVLERGKKVSFAFICLLFALFSSGYLYQGVEWILNIRKPSTIGRLHLYEEAIQIVTEENLLMGLGVLLREESELVATGSHACYIEMLFITGLAGLTLFILFQALVLRDWYRQKKILKTKAEKTVWKYLGMSLCALNIWLLTDTLIALPFIPYGYFFVCGGILLLGRMLKTTGFSEAFMKNTKSLQAAVPVPQV